MGICEFTLKETLDRLEITPNQLAVEAKIRPASIYDMYKNKSTRIHLTTLARVIDALNSILVEKGIKEEIVIEDIITYKK